MRYDLGNDLRVLGERESGIAQLQDAIAAYREALGEDTRERRPFEWARCIGKQGVALMRLADRTKIVATADIAVQQLAAASETMRAGGREPDARYFQARLTQARGIANKRRATDRLKAN